LTPLIAADPSPALAQALRGDALPAAFGVLNLGAALACAALALSRRPRDVTLLSLAACGFLYGARLLVSTVAARVLFGLDPRLARYLVFAMSYFILVPFLRFLETLVPARWRVPMRRLWQIDLAFGVAAMAFELATGAPGRLSSASSVLVLCNFAVILLALCLPGEPATWELRRLRASFIAAGIFIFGENLRTLGVLPWLEGIEPIGLMLLFVGLGSIAARRSFLSQTRLSGLQQELDMARRIQTSILPRQVPRLEGLEIAVRYVPAEEVGGDLYDFLPVAARQLGVLAADVSGHGVPAALIASMVKVAAAAQAPHAASPARVLSEMNRIFFGQLRSHFVTCAYLFVDLAAARLTWANAGHPPPLLLQGGEVHELAPTGTVMGRLSRAGYAEQAREIAPGDRVVIFSDGITEAASPAGEPFGDARLRAFLIDHATLPVEAFAAALLDALAAWSGQAGRRSAFVTPLRRAASQRESFDGRFADDLTLVVLQITANKSDARAADAKQAAGK
jgi:sigma-B regulation protein RsbU (phosphoserine phosphatase)